MSGLPALPNAVRARWPWAAEHGPLPALLILLTLLTGLVDAVSYVALGHVFVANIPATSCFWASRR